VRLARALDLIEELAVVIRQLTHDLIFGGRGGSLVKSGNEVDFLANAEFVTTHISRDKQEDRSVTLSGSIEIAKTNQCLALRAVEMVKAAGGPS
jgi:hypothetical protein